MNFKLLAFVLLIVLSSSLVLAVDITLDSRAPNYQGGNILSARVEQCAGGSSLNILNKDGGQVYYTLGEQQWTAAYNTDSDSSDGKYSLTVLCDDGTAKTVSFCVDSDGCTVIQPPAVGDGNRGGGSRCTANWVCSNWGACDALGQQTRTCTDTRCNQRPRTETQVCTCIESWVCSAWSSCQANQQYRTCTDEHSCGTLSLKPIEAQSCSIPAVSSGTNTFFQNILPPISAPPGASGGQKLLIFLKTYWLYLLLPVVLVSIGLLLYFLLHKRQHKTYNFNELREWIRKEREMGTSKEDIVQILKEQTGWNHKEIIGAFESLRQEKIGLETRSLTEVSAVS